MKCIGIGKYKSTGKGMFQIVSIETYDGFKTPDNPNGFIVLSNYIPKKEDPVTGNYRMFVKYPKLDREYALSGLPFKKPVVMLTEGSVFSTSNIAPHYGRVVEGISPLNQKIVQNGVAFALPIRIKNMIKRDYDAVLRDYH